MLVPSWVHDLDLFLDTTSKKDTDYKIILIKIKLKDKHQ